MRRRVDKFVSEKLKESHFEYEPGHWANMSAILDNESNNRKLGPWYYVIAVFVLLSFFVFLLNDRNSTEEQTAHNKIAHTETEVTSLDDQAIIVQVTPQEIAKLQQVDIDQHNSRFQRAGVVSSDELHLEYESINILPVNDSNVEDGLSEQNSIVQADNMKNDHFTGSELEPELASMDNLQLLNMQQPNSNNWGVGVGLHVENSWGWSTGAFASLDYRFNRSFSINVRPGLIFRSNQSDVAESMKDQSFDPTINNLNGDMEQLESYAVDIPLSVQIHKQRHLLSLGGGVHYAFLQRVSITETQFSGFNSFTNNSPVVFESSSDKNTWVQPTESIYPFAELYYSYLLTPSFELGGRSRFYMPEHLNMDKRLNFAAQLVWHIN